MKKLIFTLILVVMVLSATVLTGCIRVDLTQDAGPITTAQYAFTDFTGIEVGNAFEVTITPSDNYSVTITAGENVFSHLNVHKSGSTLVIEVDNWFINWYVSPKLDVTMPVLTYLELSGASKGTALGFRSSEDFRLHVSGASDLEMDIESHYFTADISGASKVTGRLIATDCDIDLSGASRISLTGSGGDIRLDCSGASTVDMADFSVDNADIDFSGASSGSLVVNGRLDVELSGASTLEYYGNPTMGKSDISGSSTIRHKG